MHIPVSYLLGDREEANRSAMQRIARGQNRALEGRWFADSLYIHTMPIMQKEIHQEIHLI